MVDASARFGETSTMPPYKAKFALSSPCTCWGYKLKVRSEKKKMCGIVACIADVRVAPALIDGLRKVEYRGYDSAGIATVHAGKISVRKDVGKVAEIEKKTRASSLEGMVGVAHTRWATHGSVTSENAHPHTSCMEDVAIVHNGIIQNYLDLKKELVSRGHSFKSKTDSEVIAHLIEEEYKSSGDPVGATAKAAARLRGQYAFVAIFSDRPDLLIGTRNDAPLLAGISERKKFFASDVLAFIEHTDRVVFLENFEIGVLTDQSLRIFDIQGRELKRDVTQIAWELGDISKLEYAHHTLKEIHEQPKSVVSAMMQDTEKLAAFSRALSGADSVILTAAGSSYHAALTMKNRLNREARIRCDAILSGEFKHQSHFIDKETVLVAVSQSGETADVLEAVKIARENGAKVLSVVNAAGSSLARASDSVLLLNCGPEVGVAATKSFTAQVMVLNMVVDGILGRDTVGVAQRVSRAVEAALSTEERAKQLARMYGNRNDFYFIARGEHYPIAMEGALKLKELSYVHAEGMAASELKHGTLALIEKGTPVVVINPEGETYDDTLSNAQELKARGAEIIGVSDAPHEVYDQVMTIPRAGSSVLPILEVIPLQFLAYWMAVERSNDPDYPRNLAKSVTVR